MKPDMKRKRQMRGHIPQSKRSERLRSVLLNLNVRLKRLRKESLSSNIKPKKLKNACNKLSLNGKRLSQNREPASDRILSLSRLKSVTTEIGIIKGPLLKLTRMILISAPMARKVLILLMISLLGLSPSST